MTDQPKQVSTVFSCFCLLVVVLAICLPLAGFTISFSYSRNHLLAVLSTKHPSDAAHDRDTANADRSGIDTDDTNAALPPSQPDQPLNTSTTSDSTQDSPSKTQSKDPPEPELLPTAISNSSCNMPRPPEYTLQPPQEEVPQLIHDYIAFHKTARACLLNPDCKQKPKILVVTCPRKGGCLGLGDRMRGISFSFMIALVTKRVLFLHDMSDPYPLEAGLSPASVDWTLPPNIEYTHSWPYLEWYWCLKGIGKPCVYNRPILTNFANFDVQDPDINMLTDDIVKLFDGKGRFISLACRMAYKKLSFLQKNPYFNDTYSELSKAVTARQFSIQKLLFQPSEATRQMLKTLEFSGEYLSVHIRNGIDAKETGNKRFQYLSSHEEEVVDNILECVGRLGEEQNISNVFVASDSSNTKKMFSRKGEKKMVLDVHLFEKKTLHYKKQRFFGSTTWDALCEGFISIFADLFMLARGKNMIVTGSNLSAFASYLGGHLEIVRFDAEKKSVDEWCRTFRIRR